MGEYGPGYFDQKLQYNEGVNWDEKVEGHARVITGGQERVILEEGPVLSIPLSLQKKEIATKVVVYKINTFSFVKTKNNNRYISRVSFLSGYLNTIVPKYQRWLSR